MDRYIEMLQNMETIPEKDVRQICDKVYSLTISGQINTHGRIKHGIGSSSSYSLWRHSWTIS